MWQSSPARQTRPEQHAPVSAPTRAQSLATSADSSAPGQSSWSWLPWRSESPSAAGPSGIAAEPEAVQFVSGMLIVAQMAASSRWLELMVLLPLEGFKCIVATSEMDITEVDLLEDYGAFVLPTSDHPRPALDLLAEGITVVTFEDGAHGRLPAGRFLAGLVQQAERLAEASGHETGDDDDDEIQGGFMRGGAEPRRTRIDKKVPDPEAWIVVFHHLADAGTAAPIGSIIKAWASLRRLGNFGVDRDGGSGHYFL